MSKKNKPRELNEAEKAFMVEIEKMADKAIAAGTFTEKNVELALGIAKLMLNPDTAKVVDIEKVFDPQDPNGEDELIIKIPVPKKYT